MVTIQIGSLRQVATLENPGPPVMDGDGSYTQSYVPLNPPTWRCAIEKASVQQSEKHFASTVLSHATYIFSGRFHPQISSLLPTRIQWTDRAGIVHTGTVLDVNDTEGAGVETVLLVTEVAQ
jgi:hypothetical protein